MKAVLSFIVPSLSEKSIKVLVDNEGAINLAANPLSSARTKHTDESSHGGGAAESSELLT